jgi:hypothetical protein
MKPLARLRFLDELWSVADLDDAGEFWLRCYELLDGESGFPRKPDRSHEINIRGFPRLATSALASQLAARMSASEFVRAELSMPEPDAIRVSTEPRPSKHAPPRGLGLPLLTTVCDGMPVELRFTISGRAGRLLQVIRFSSTLVIHGEVRGDGLLVKTVWRTGASGWEDRVHPREESVEGTKFLRAFAEYRDSGTVPTKRSARVFFRTGDADFVGKLLYKSIRVPFDGFRLPGLLLRVSIQAVCITLLSIVLGALIENGNWLGVLAVIAWLILPAIAVGFFWLVEFNILIKGRRYLRSVFTRHFGESRLQTLGPSESTERTDDPNVRKLTAELLAAGFTHLGDLLSALNDGDGMLIRVFADPSRTAILTAGFVASQEFGAGTVFHFWPRAVALQAYTFFRSGGRVETATASFSYRRLRPGPDSLIRYVPDTFDPLELHRCHLAFVAEFAQERSLDPLPAVRFDEFVRRLEQIREEGRQHFEERGLSLSDHLRWYLQWPRREVRG